MTTSMTPNPHREAGHTPGPWRANGNAIQTETGEYVANLSSPRGAEQRERDAHLIAAAPGLYDMLEIVTDVIEVINETFQKHGLEPCYNAEDIALSSRAILAKARGESA
jgi:hypothetical protein